MVFLRFCVSIEGDSQVYIKSDMSPVVKLRVITSLDGNARIFS